MFLKNFLLITATAAALPQQQPLSNSQHLPNEDSARASAPQVFNALHSAMRQWGSSLNHNGMSFFPATIPKNTDLYHGRHTTEPVTGTEWLAFEIEHAENFARNHGPGSPGPPGKGGKGRHPPKDSLDGPPGNSPPPNEDEREELKKRAAENMAALHVYRTTRELNVLFLDGMSAGKTSLGTLDQQDYVLCNDTADNPRGVSYTEETIQAGPPGDSSRATQMCEDFGDSIDGIVRMEAGFELIMCDFSNGVKLVSVTPRPTASDQAEHDEMRDFEYLRGISYRYQGITAGRVKVDYSNMVSAFFHKINLTNPDPKKADLPRLISAESDITQAIKAEVIASLALEKKKSLSIDWQGVVDLIVTRYLDRLQYMASAKTPHDTLVAELNFLLNTYVDYSVESPDISAAIEKCANHYLDPLDLSTKIDHLLHASVSTITSRICNTLFTVRSSLLETNSTSTTEEAKEEVNELTKYLSWTTWLECGKCQYDEVCFVAIWPWGGVKDHEQPGCVKTDDFDDRRGYWGGFGPGGPGGRRPGGPGEKPGDEHGHSDM